MQRRGVMLAIAAGLVLPATMARAQQLGLAERRAIKNYQDTIFPGIQKDIDAAAAVPLPVEVEWDKIAVPGKAPDFDKPVFWTDIYFTPLIAALKSITADAMGKEALAAKLKKVVITFDDKTAPASNYANGLKFDGGTLTINFRPYSNSGDVKERTRTIQALLENNL